MLELPITNDAWQEFTIDLGGRSIVFDLKYNERTGAWTADLYDEVTQEALVLSLPLTTSVDIFAPHNLDLGHLVLLDLRGGPPQDPDVSSFGLDHKLYWMSSDELAAELVAS